MESKSAPERRQGFRGERVDRKETPTQKHGSNTTNKSSHPPPNALTNETNADLDYTWLTK